MIEKVLTKKVLPVFGVLCFLAFLSSCASLPKEVRPGDTLVIGRVEVYAHDFKITSYNVDYNGRYKSGVEITISDMATGKEKIVTTDEDGCFYVSGLKAGNKYGITKAKFHASGVNAGGSMWVNLSDPKVFAPIDNQVLNLGCTYYNFDGANGWVTYETKNHYYVREFFEDLDEESEWFDKPIVDFR